ncbi:MAG TPA: histidine phosphatase family protein [Bacteroidales bacterium]|nr:MAG: phosphohistidine phosphatase [Bacteroidetes bacterium ADurb.Bin217]HPH15877.1 histidine phosphatase family protein [Bacteroidales bacterium]HPM12184.1 histidine phosphatase family protein [Bacteroidales bacterium]
MKRYLIILRHAKSDWGDVNLNDFDRPLNSRGKRDIPLMASYIIQHYPTIDMAIVSDSVRTTETIEGLRKYGVSISELSFSHSLYLASAETIASSLSTIDASIESALICAHNPGVSEFVQSLCTLDFFDMPTLGSVLIEIDIAQWSDIFSSKGSLIRFDYPKKK